MLMQFSLYQIITPIGSVLILIYGIMNFKQNKISFGELVMWFVAWGGIAVSALFPDKVISFSSKFTGIASGVNAIVIPGLVLMLFIIFKLYAKIDFMERRFVKLIQNLAIEKALEKDEKKPEEEKQTKKD